MSADSGLLAAVGSSLTQLVLGAPENALEDFPGVSVFAKPLWGVADGDDPLFARFREVVSTGHLMPRGLLAEHADDGADLTAVRVVSWALPFTEPVRLSNRAGLWPSRLYSLARNNGGALNRLVRERLVRNLREQGFAAVAPALTDAYGAFRCPEHTFSSTWSERHVAYAAGLGQFGLNRALITEAGTCVRLGSVVTNAPVPVTPRKYDTHQAPCSESRGAICGRCMAKCPVGAITADGMDKERCYSMRQAVRDRFMDAYTREMDMLSAPIVKGGRRTAGYSLGCALCMCGVPCEFARPDYDSMEPSGA